MKCFSRIESKKWYGATEYVLHFFSLFENIYFFFWFFWTKRLTVGSEHDNRGRVFTLVYYLYSFVQITEKQEIKYCSFTRCYKCVITGIEHDVLYRLVSHLVRTKSRQKKRSNFRALILLIVVYIRFKLSIKLFTLSHVGNITCS